MKTKTAAMKIIFLTTSPAESLFHGSIALRSLLKKPSLNSLSISLTPSVSGSFPLFAFTLASAPLISSTILSKWISQVVLLTIDKPPIDKLLEIKAYPILIDRTNNKTTKYFFFFFYAAVRCQPQTWAKCKGGAEKRDV